MTTKSLQRSQKQSIYGIILGIFLLLIGASWWQHGKTDVQILPESFSKQANQYLQQDQKNQNLTLLLQKDERWAMLDYGLEKHNNDIAHNGCALASLAMIDGYWQQETPDIHEILDWAENRYYVKGQGTSWQIFGDFAAEKGYQYEDLGNYYNRAKELMNQGIPVIVSVGPGTFTTSGHILVLITDTNGYLRAYDPNDDGKKKHYEKTWTPEIFLQEAVHYWALWQS